MAPRADDRYTPTLADIVREETNDGLDILRFLIQAFTGKLEGSGVSDRLEVAGILMDLFLDAALLRRGPPDSALMIVIGGSLDLFRDVVRFQTDVVSGRREGVALPGRIALAERLRNDRRLLDSGEAEGRFSSVLRSRDTRRSDDRPLPPRRRRRQNRRRHPERRPQRAEGARKLT